MLPGSYEAVGTVVVVVDVVVSVVVVSESSKSSSTSSVGGRLTEKMLAFKKNHDKLYSESLLM